MYLRFDGRFEGTPRPRHLQPGVFHLLDPKALRECLTQHGKAIVGVLSEKQSCLDGKKLNGGSPHRQGNTGLYLVNAWVSENRLCLGQHRVENKSNDGQALRPLLAQLEWGEAIVTLDAAGCRPAAAQASIDQNGHSLRALKAKQESLWEEVSCVFKASNGTCSEETWPYSRERFERHAAGQRRCWILPAREHLQRAFIEPWPGLQTVVNVEARRRVRGELREEVRHYIREEEETNPVYYSKLVRGQWGIETHVHWPLAVTFNRSGGP